MSKRRHYDNCSIGSRAYATCLYGFLIVYTFIFLFGKSLLPPEEKWCPYHNLPVRNGYHNPDYNYHPCHHYRTPYLLFLHLQEVDYAQRMMISLLLGGIIGFERRASERPAGIRTMSLVCLGSCFFSMCSQLAFKSSTMGWDAARVAAAVPSGVGFLGAGLIWKGNTSILKNMDGKMVVSESQEVHGLTTAASVWLAAAVGVAVGGGRRLYIVSVYGVLLVILVLRFGPQLYFTSDAESQKDFDDFIDDDDSELDWDSVTDDSSQDLSQAMNEEGDDEEGPKAESTIWGSGNDFNALGYPLSTNDIPAISMSRHSSAPNLATYETPIKDATSRGKDLRKSLRTKNLPKPSFHS